LKPFDADGRFQRSWQGEGLRQVAVRGAGVAVFSQGLAFVTQLFATIILARLLTPADFGIVTMVTTISLLLMSFGQNGYPEAIMQRQEIGHFLASNLFWINIGMGSLLTVIFAAAGSLLAKFYGDPRVTMVTLALSATILISSTSVVHTALLKRAMRFSVTSSNEVIASVVSVVVSIIFAWMGWGYWALVAGLIARPLVQSMGAWYLCRWIPGLPRRLAGTASIVWFASHVYGRFTFNYFTRNTDNLLVGWRFGSSSLGVYKKAYDLFLLPANQLLIPVVDVALSTLSRLERGSAEYKRYFLSGLSILAFVGMGAGALLTLTGKDLIRILLGAKWDAAGQIFTFFAPGIGIMLISGSTGMIHLSIGTADRWLRWVLLEFGITVLLFLLGLHWGPVGVACAWTASSWILSIPAFWYAGRPIQFGVGPVFSVVWKYVLASWTAACASTVIIGEMHLLAAAPGIMGAFTRTAIGCLLFSILYFGGIIILHGGLGPIYRFVGLLPDIFAWARSRRTLPPEPAVPGSPGI
jgi:PST family polysaccharide transporter